VNTEEMNTEEDKAIEAAFQTFVSATVAFEAARAAFRLAKNDYSSATNDNDYKSAQAKLLLTIEACASTKDQLISARDAYVYASVVYLAANKEGATK